MTGKNSEKTLRTREIEKFQMTKPKAVKPIWVWIQDLSAHSLRLFPQFPVYSFRRDSRSILRERVNVVQVEASRLTRTKHEQLLALCSRKSLAFARNSHFLFFLFFFFFFFLISHPSPRVFWNIQAARNGSLRILSIYHPLVFLFGRRRNR